MFENRPLVPSLVVLSVDQPIEPTMNHANAEALLSYGGPKIKKATMKWAFPLETIKSMFNAPHVRSPLLLGQVLYAWWGDLSRKQRASGGVEIVPLVQKEKAASIISL